MPQPMFKFDYFATETLHENKSADYGYHPRKRPGDLKGVRGITDVNPAVQLNLPRLQP